MVEIPNVRDGYAIVFICMLCVVGDFLGLTLLKYRLTLYGMVYHLKSEDLDIMELV